MSDDYCSRECFRVAFRIVCKFAPKANPSTVDASNNPSLPPNVIAFATSIRQDNALEGEFASDGSAPSRRSYRVEGN